MTATGATPTHQAFRVRAEGPSNVTAPVDIRLEFDSRINQYIVRWSEIQRVFENPRYIVHGNETISLVIDENLNELTPPRIVARPDVVLDVVLEHFSSPGSPASVSGTLLRRHASTAGTTEHLSYTPPTRRSLQPSLRRSPEQAVQTSLNVALADIKRPITPGASFSHPGNYPWAYSENHPLVLTSGWEGLQYNVADPDTPLVNAYAVSFTHQNYPLVDFSRGSDVDAAARHDTPSLRAAREMAVVNTSRARTWTSAHPTPEQVHAVSVITQENPAATQQPQTYVDRSELPHIVEYLTQVNSLRWHEAPMPRLFIVMPRVFSEVLDLTRDTFRLFWMCEYMGDPSESEDLLKPTIIPHMDLHQGFDLDRPAEFFMKYRPHLLRNFQVFMYDLYWNPYRGKSSKVGTSNEPDIRYDQAIRHLQGMLNMTEEQVEQSLSMVLSHLMTLSSAAPDVASSRRSILSFSAPKWSNNPPQLTPQDFAQLQSFLLKPGTKRTGAENVGNLYRSVDINGNVHWVCLAHLHAIYPYSLFGQTFMRDTEALCGTYNAHKGQIAARPRSGLQARILYAILKSSPGFVPEIFLDIGKEWTISDLGYMCKVVTESKATSLNLTGPADYLASRASSELLLQILMNEQIQSFSMENAQGLLKHAPPIMLQSGAFKSLQSLRLTLDTDGQAATVLLYLHKVINCSPFLEDLSIRWDELETEQNIEIFLSNLTNRSTPLAVNLKVKGQDVSLTINKGDIGDISLEVADLSWAYNNTLISQYQVETLRIMARIVFSDPDTEPRLRWVLSHSSALVKLTLTCCALDFRLVEDMIRRVTGELPADCGPQWLVLRETEDDNIRAIFPLASPQGDSAQVDITVYEHDKGLESLLQTYGSVVRTFNTTHTSGQSQLKFLYHAMRLKKETSQLASMMIALNCGKWRAYEPLKGIFEICSGTLMQLTLVGFMERQEDEVLFLETLKSYGGRQLIISKTRQPLTPPGPPQVLRRGNTSFFNSRFRSDSNGQGTAQSRDLDAVMQRWIAKIKEKLPRVDLKVVDDFEALCDIVPGVTRNSFTRLQRT
ncbi:hypothetical protein BC939DRAFT_532902 [Gamsiella multidivaricata]|uniref:uncharacterized protein n=1 Tax=Gamsiella multidivaricata TaxID=101098 RepID=UPI00221E3D06|nr:uncharacterized protein BC939DRAFT_532902 [Gamsiella multidivaricata]KAG0367824.1 hypothetical protein BGZ54_003199 [Gamsiella multidivaricata]KAI7817291.1 hypothetical protein BC939DRAFT_532902 [Gamsiella multidivaricata]